MIMINMMIGKGFVERKRKDLPLGLKGNGLNEIKKVFRIGRIPLVKNARLRDL